MHRARSENPAVSVGHVLLVESLWDDAMLATKNSRMGDLGRVEVVGDRGESLSWLNMLCLTGQESLLLRGACGELQRDM